MSESKGYIDIIEGGFVSGWVAADDLSDVQLFCGDESLGFIKELSFRQDIVDAGISEGNTGFRFDAVDFLAKMTGLQSLSIRIDGKVINEKELYLPTGTNFILNPFLELEDRFSLKNANINTNHRIGMHINRFVAPTELMLSNGGYTRIAFDDEKNTKSIFEIDINIDQAIADNLSPDPLEFTIVAKSSHTINIHVTWLNKEGYCVYDEPILIGQNWEIKTHKLNIDLSAQIRAGELTLQLRTKHYGRRNFDIAMLALTDDINKLQTPIQEKNTEAKTLSSAYEGNVLNNGELIQWSKGVDFSEFNRGQELANNWFVEMSKANHGNVQIAVAADNLRQDPLAKNLESKFGLRARTNKLDGYARLICAFNTSLLSVLDYEISIDIEAASFNKKTVLPRIYFIPRNAYEDNIVIEVARKISLVGRQTLTFDLSSYQMQEILTKTDGMPVMVLAIDLPSSDDIIIHSASFNVCESAGKPSVEQEIDVTVQEGLFFEDSSISEQLYLLKGLESWVTGEPVTLPVKNTNTTNELEITNNNEFGSIVHSLTPHKMARPARNFPFIDIIVPVYNACDDVLLCLSSLIEKTDLVHRVLIVNDGDEERTTEMLKAFETSFNHVELIDNPVNIGYTKSVNKGIKHSNAEWAVVLNSDTIVSEGWLGRLMNCALSSEKVGMVGPLSNAASWQSIPEIHDKDGDWHLNPLPKGLSIDAFAKMVELHSMRDYPNVGVINGFCQLINMELLDEIGLLDEIAFPVGYGEENDMCARAVKAGYKLLIADDTYVFHAKSKSFGHEQRKKLAKQGSTALKKKHPDVDWGEVTRLFKENPALNTLRDNILKELQQFESGAAQ